ncbi:MAG: hypothetical protein ACI4QR_00755, partial [Eubacteriales bacterium]
MKKILTILSAVILALSVFATSALAVTGITYDNRNINCIDFLDFSEKTNDWAQYDEETGKWKNVLTVNPMDENYKTTGAYLEEKRYNYASTLDWSLEGDGEYLHIEATEAKTGAGMPFVLDGFMSDISIGSEAGGGAEYVKIRLRNNSSSTKIAFGF